MSPDRANQLIHSWWNQTFYSDIPTLTDIPLLKVMSDGITPITSPNDQRLLCSDQLIAKITQVSQRIQADWNADRKIDGVAYLVYRRTGVGAIDPFYVGIANSSNKQGNSYSSLWKFKGARFGDALKSNGHVDCLSRSLAGLYAGYIPWVNAFFGLGASFKSQTPPPLLQPVFVHLEIWNASAHRVIPETPEAPLYVEEMHRLWALKTAGYGSQLLNRDGN
jgi:hypothetical protein